MHSTIPFDNAERAGGVHLTPHPPPLLPARSQAPHSTLAMKFILALALLLSPAVAFNQAMPKAATKPATVPSAVVLPGGEYEVDPLDNPDIKSDDSINMARKVREEASAAVVATFAVDDGS